MSTRRVLAPNEIEARRRNAQKSTGPRTQRGKRRAALNASKGRAPRSGPPPTMLALGENPSQYERLLRELVQAHQPANSAERLLVEDIALLRLRKQRNQRAQNGLILKNLEKLAHERYARQEEISHESSGFSYEQAEETGLLNIEDSPAKFKEVARLLDLLIAAVDRGEFTEDGSEMLQMLFGPNPSMRGARILGFYSHLESRGGVPASPEEEGNSPTCEGAETGANLTLTLARASEGEPDAADEEKGLDESIYNDLCLALLEERLLTGEKYQRYLAEHIPSIPALRAAALAPSEEEYRGLIRQEQFLDQQIERKTKLLLFMQWVARSAARNAEPYIYDEKKRS